MGCIHIPRQIKFQHVEPIPTLQVTQQPRDPRDLIEEGNDPSNGTITDGGLSFDPSTRLEAKVKTKQSYNRCPQAYQLQGDSHSCSRSCC